MTQATTTQRPAKPHRPGIWEWLLNSTIGNAFRFVWWSFAAIGISVLIEWAGMIWFWGPEHSQAILKQEMNYLSEFNRNMLLGVYPSDLGEQFVGNANTVVSFLHLREISAYFADGVMGTVTMIAVYG